MKRRTVQRFSGRGTASTWVIVGAIFLVVIAFFPTLVFDYAAQDQLRAFRYSVPAESVLWRAEACVRLIHSFYVMTGRPLVWPAECIEHALVARIGDFGWLRYLALTVYVLSTGALGLALGPLFGSKAAGFVIAAVAMMTPGIVFMYYQGLTGAPVVLCIFLTSISFLLINRAEQHLRSTRAALEIAGGIGLYLVSCFIYPAFSFLWVPLALLYFGFDTRLVLHDRFWRALRTGAYYTVGTAVYFLAAKLISWALVPAHERSADLGQYNFSAHFSSSHLFERLQELLAFLTSQEAPVGLLFDIPWPITIAILIAPAFFVASHPRLRLSAGGMYLFATVGAVVISVLPWLLSGFEGVSLRHTMPIHVLLVVALAIVVHRTVATRGHVVALGALGALLIPTAAIQLTHSIAEVQRSGMELKPMRQALQRLIQSDDLTRIRQFHVIRPSEPLYIYGSPVSTRHEFGRSAVRSNPEHISQIMTALLRELLPDSKLRGLAIRDCRFDRECITIVRETGNAIALSQSNDGFKPFLLECSYVLDYRLEQKQAPEVMYPEPLPNTCVSGLAGLQIELPQTSAVRHSPYQAFDGSTSPDDFWETHMNGAVILQFSLPSPITIHSYQFLKGEDMSRRPVAWRLEASYNDNEWIVLDTQDTSVTKWVDVDKVYSTNAENAYLRYRFVFERSADPEILRIYEIAIN